MPGIVLSSRGKNMNEKNMLSTFVEWPSAIQRSQQTSDSVQHSEERAVIEEMLVISEYTGGVHISWGCHNQVPAHLTHTGGSVPDHHKMTVK